jgi:hypothetical protein
MVRNSGEKSKGRGIDGSGDRGIESSETQNLTAKDAGDAKEFGNISRNR